MRILKNDIIEFTVDTLGIYGEGIAHVEGRTVFIRGGLPGERVRARIIFERPTFCDARLEKILEPSPDRIRPVCPVFGACGGCALQHMRYEAELRYKKTRLEETFYKVAHLSVDSRPPVCSPKRERYRNKLSLPVRAGKDGAMIGFFARDSHRVVPIADCWLQPEWVKRVIAVTHDFLEKNGLQGYDEQTGTGDVRHITVREIGGRLYIAAVLCHAATDEDALRRVYLDAFGQDCRLYLNINPRKTNVIYGDAWKRLHGSDTPTTVDGLLTDVHPASFFQVNDGVRPLLYQAVLDAVEADTVIDAYAGAGLLTAKLAAKCRRAVGIELDPSAAAAARRTAELNKIGLDNREGDCAALLPIALQEFPDATVVLDPPRQGVDAAVTQAIADSRVKTVLYVSCNPATLARDVERLAQGGFTVASAQVFDMFPMTASMESFTVLKR